MADLHLEEAPTILYNWLSQARTGGVRLLAGGSTRLIDWQTVHSDVTRVAEYLKASNISAGCRVGIRGENCYQWLALDLALLRLGAIPVAIPVADFKGHSNAEIARQYGLVAIFAEKGARATDDRATVALEDLFHLPELSPLTDLDTVYRSRWPEDARHEFTVAFSSGTAGRIKCLLMYWQGVRKLIEITASTYPLSASDRIMIALPLSTFQQRYLCYLAIYSGCEVIITTTSGYLSALGTAQPTVILGPPNFYEFAEARYRNKPKYRRLANKAAARCTMILPAAKARQAVLQRIFNDSYQAFGGRARLMLIGSAPVRPQLLEFFAMAGFNLFQIYGMTETGYLSWNVPGAHRRGSVGRECYPGSVFIRDGEVLIKHPWHICLGYEGEAVADAQAVFLGDNTIATGDLGVFEDGYLFLSGRKKNLIVTAGGRKLQIEDLESDLRQAAGVNTIALYPLGGDAGFAAVVWFNGVRSEAEDSLKRRVRQLGIRMGVDTRITRAAFLEGDLAPDSPLLNRNLKFNREVIKSTTTAQLETVDWKTR